MGNLYSKTIEAFGWTAMKSIEALDALLAFKYNSELRVDIKTNKHFVVANDRPYYIQLEKISDKGPFRAFVRI